MYFSVRSVSQWLIKSGSPLLVVVLLGRFAFGHLWKDLSHAEAQRRGVRLEIIGDAFNAIFEQRGAEIEQQTEMTIHEFEVSQQLFAVHRG